jgi:hypothetical protein
MERETLGVVTQPTRRQVTFGVMEMSEMNRVDDEMRAKWQKIFDKDDIDVDDLQETFRNYLAINLAYNNRDEEITQDMIDYAMTAVLTWN